MNKRISDMLNSMSGDLVDIQLKELASTDRIKEITMSKIHAEKRHATRPRLLPVAAVIAMALCLSAFTIWQLSLKNMQGNTEDSLMMSGLSGYPEYEAAVEWEGYVKDWYEAGENMASPETKGDEYALNHAFSDEAKQTLDSILDKYGLEMHGIQGYPKSVQELYAGTGSSGFMPPEGDSGDAPKGGRLYDDGSFMCNAAALLPNGDSLRYTFYSFKKGTFTRTGSLVAAADEFEEWMYDAGGIQVLLAVSENKSVMVADMADCFVFVNILSGSENTDPDSHSFSWPTVDREALEDFADSFDFAAINELCK